MLIERGGDPLAFLATDIEIQISARSGGRGAGRRRAPSPSARASCSTSCARCPRARRSRWQQQDKRLLVKAGKSRFSCRRCRPRTSRGSPAPAGETVAFELPQKALRRLLALVQYAMAQQDIRYYLNGLLMVVEDGSLKLVATDGHRLAFAALKLAAPTLPRQEVIVPRKTVLELDKLLADSDDAGEDRAVGDARRRSASAASSSCRS